MKCLFNMKDGKAQITDWTRLIWQYNDIIEEHGEQLATKVFTVFHGMSDLTLDNPFSNLPENTKLETIVSALAPETSLTVDWNSYEMIDAIELTRTLYETPSYRYYLAKKEVLDKAIITYRFAPQDASKEFGNADQVSKWDKYIQEAKTSTKAAFEEFLDEQGTIEVRGQGKKSKNNRYNSNIPKNLD